MQIASWELEQDAIDRAKGHRRCVNRKALAKRAARERAAKKGRA
jgi:hypothetical protein